MPRAKASIGTTNFAVSILAGEHQLSADERVEQGGKDAGPTPTELLCTALCACTAITLRMYAQRKQWSLLTAHVDVHYERNDAGGKIARTLRLEGDLDNAQRARLADIAERTPVTLMIKQGLPIKTTLE